jgi:hypothetical protein
MMSVEVVFGEPEEEQEAGQQEGGKLDPDEFFAKNAFRIVYQTNNFFLPQVRDLIDKGEILNLRPEYQRRLRWTSVQKSKLVESLLLNIPVPPVFLYESDAARYEVMDGQQRLNAVREFIAGDFALSGLTVLKPLNGLRYSRCPPRIKRALDRGTLSAVVLLLESEKDATTGQLTLTDIRRFIFDRLNTGGTKLNPQEIRNALNPGIFNRMILDLTRHSLFTRIFDIPPYSEADPNDYYENPARQKNSLYSTMGDCQLVVRYFALRDQTNIRGSMKSMLDRAMCAQITESEKDALQSEYIDRLLFLDELFLGHAFELLPDEKGHVRLSAAVYDSSMAAMNELWSEREAVAADAQGVRARMATALTNGEELTLLTGAGNTANSIKGRINLMRKILHPE